MLDKVVDLSSWKIEIRKEMDFFLGAGGRGFWLLTFLGRVPKKRSKNVSRTKIDLQVFPGVFPYLLG